MCDHLVYWTIASRLGLKPNRVECLVETMEKIPEDVKDKVALIINVGRKIRQIMMCVIERERNSRKGERVRVRAELLLSQRERERYVECDVFR